MNNKKAESPLIETIVFIIFILVFVGLISAVSYRAGSNVVIDEQIYAKQIALAIDKAKPGMDVDLDVSELFYLAKKKKYKGNVVEIDNENNKVIVRLVEGKGYEHYFFSKVNVVWNLDKEKGLLKMEVVGNE